MAWPPWHSLKAVSTVPANLSNFSLNCTTFPSSTGSLFACRPPSLGLSYMRGSGGWKSRKAEEGRQEKPDGSPGWQGEGGPQWQTPWRDGERWRPKRRGRSWPLMGCFWPFTVSWVKWWWEKTVERGWGVVRRETETRGVKTSSRSKEREGKYDWAEPREDLHHGESWTFLWLKMG